MMKLSAANNEGGHIRWLVSAGVDLRNVQELASHQTISMRVRYATCPPHNHAAIQKWDALAQ